MELVIRVKILNEAIYVQIVFITLRIVGFGFFVYMNINLGGISNIKAILQEEDEWYYLIQSLDWVGFFV